MSVPPPPPPSQQHRMNRYASRWDNLPQTSKERNHITTSKYQKNSSNTSPPKRRNHHPNNKNASHQHSVPPPPQQQQQQEERRHPRHRWKETEPPRYFGQPTTNELLLQQYRSLQNSYWNVLSQQHNKISNHSDNFIPLEQQHELPEVVVLVVLYDLVTFLTTHYTVLPAEETAMMVVHEILLPTLLRLVSQQSTMMMTEEEEKEEGHPASKERTTTTTTGVTVITAQDIIDVIQKLLGSRPHASAMLSPITTFLPNDEDRHHSNRMWNITPPPPHYHSTTNINPTRMKLWSVLQQCLPMTVECFTTCVEMTQRLEEDHHDHHHGTLVSNGHRPKYSSARRTNHHYPPPILDLPRIIKLLREALAMNDEPLAVVDTEALCQRQEQGFHLLLRLLQYQPTNQIITSSVSFLQALLFPNYTITHRHDQPQPPRDVMDCPYCGWQHCHPHHAPSSFLMILHGSSSGGSPSTPQPPILAWSCATQLLQSMPLSLWFGNCSNSGSSGHKNSHKNHQTPKPKKRSTFQQNLLDVLDDMTRIAYCQVQQQRSRNHNHHDDDTIIGHNVTAELGAYIKVILMHIPLDEYDVILFDSGRKKSGQPDVWAVKLVDTIMSQSLSSVDTIFTKMITECLRGHITTTGPLQRTSPPIEMWLQQEGRSFLKDLLSNVILAVPSSNILSLLYDILRSHPDLTLAHLPPTSIIHDPQQDTCLSPWSLLKCVMTQYTLTEPEMVAQCMERLLLGRHNYMKDVIATPSVRTVTLEELLEVMLPIFESYIRGHHVSDYIQGLACICISHFFTDDWNTILHLMSTTDPSLLDGMLILIQRIVQNCTDARVSETLQVTCCKSIGNICTALIPSRCMVDHYQKAHSIVMNSFQALEQTISHEHAIAIRCMAMFALGNLSHAVVTTPTNFDLLGVDVMDMLTELAELCILGMSDVNEKFATNAIRTAAYMAGLVLQYPDQLPYYGRKQQLLRRAIAIYVDKIRLVMALESECESTQEVHYSWKQRLAIRKQGWGSCNSLSFLLERDILTQLSSTRDNDDKNNDNRTSENSVENDVVSCLVECFENIDTVHEKVVLSACMAFRSIPNLSSLTNDILLGRAMVACSTFLFGDTSTTECNDQPTKKLKMEMESLLETLLLHCRETSILEALQTETFVSNICPLFQWMVHQDCSPTTFQLFANTLAISGVIDVNVEQQFINHSRSYESAIQSDLLDEI